MFLPSVLLLAQNLVADRAGMAAHFANLAWHVAYPVLGIWLAGDSISISESSLYMTRMISGGHSPSVSVCVALLLLLLLLFPQQCCCWLERGRSFRKSVCVYSRCPRLASNFALDVRQLHEKWSAVAGRGVSDVERNLLQSAV